ncbi:DUF58 domain-containing protein [Sulfurimonas sp.]|jgi:uncharacterized protein (DUF58 family)|uniref:DUF58 domain-containing protein n=1 Tax=Sulfurimonas sp. TaxID=2022749 RepID=UPI0025EF13C4|nr:DUF58 domain-containing protein [Sulfurimonas sp.]
MSKLQKILVKARRQVFSEMVGNNASIFHGEGYDFIELREYAPGDDIRHIDWNITAKMQKPFIKIFREERELNIVIASVLNGSVHFGAKKFKQEVIAELVALLGYSTIKNGDLLSSYIFTDKMISHNRPSKKLSHIQKSVDEVLKFNALNQKVDFSVLSDTLFKRLKRKSVILIVGDFFEIPDFKLLARKHEIIAIIVRDHLEEKPPKMGFSSLVDPESGALLEGDFNAKSVETYAQKVQAHDRELFKVLRREQVRFTKVYTDSNPTVALRRLFDGK